MKTDLDITEEKEYQMSGDISKMPKGLSDTDIKKGFLMWEDEADQVGGLSSGSGLQEKKEEARATNDLRKAMQTLRIAMYACSLACATALQCVHIYPCTSHVFHGGHI